MHGNRRPESVVEHDPEEEHACKPRIQDTEQALVLVAISKKRVGTKDRRTDRETRLVVQKVVKITKRREIREPTNHVNVKPLRYSETEETEEEEIEELDARNGAQENQPAKTNFFHEAGPRRDEQALDEGFGTGRSGGVTVDDAQKRLKPGTPSEDWPARQNAVNETVLRRPEIERVEGDYAREDPVDECNPQGTNECGKKVVALVLFFEIGHRR